MISRTPSFLLALAAATTLAACGSSKAPGVMPAPGNGATVASVPTTPTPPPALRNKPAVEVPKGPPPKRLVTKDLVPGTGAAAASTSTVTVNYVGVIYKTGHEFDSSWKLNQPLTRPLSSLIPGWIKGLAGMRVGGRRELIIPPSLGYGAAGRPPTIPPNSTLVFVIDLLAVA